MLQEREWPLLSKASKGSNEVKEGGPELTIECSKMEVIDHLKKYFSLISFLMFIFEFSFKDIFTEF